MSIPDPIVLLDARAKYVHPAFQMTRASTKTVFDSAGRLVTVPTNALGWDHDPATGQARGYLSEPPATNLLLHSNGLDESAWSTASSSITPDAITGPDGKGMAKLVEDSSNSLHYVHQSFTITDGANVVASIIARAGERVACRLYVNESGNRNGNHGRVHVNLIDGQVTSTGVAGPAVVLDAGVEDLGGGFSRIWLCVSLGAGITAGTVGLYMENGGAVTYQGDGTSGIYLGYGQAEEGSYPTSYIETGGATATRAGDGLILDIGAERWWRGDKGTFLVDIDMREGDMVGDILSTRDDFRVACTGSGDVRGCRLAGELAGLVTIVPSNTERARHRIAVSWDDQEAVCASDGAITNVVPSSGDGIDPTRNFMIGARPSVSGTPAGDHLNGPVERVIYYPQRLSNADLQSLTAIQE